MTDSRLPVGKNRYDAVLFDLDGVLTDTATLHAASWKKLFDAYLRARDGPDFTPFDIGTDYRAHVDGKPRYQGVESFLRSRHIELPFGTPDDPPDRETVCGLGNRKNRIFHQCLEREGVAPFRHAVAFVRSLRRRGIATAVVSSSRNCGAIVKAAALEALFDVRVDGVDAARLALKGKPDPDMFLEAARRLGVTPGRAVVVEDALAGVAAGRNGGFGLVVGVDRSGHPEDLEAHGADLVVTRLTDVPLAEPDPRPIDDLPSALVHVGDIAKVAASGRLAVFLDYDGTLTPIVDRPDLAVLSPAMRDALEALARRCTVAVISGRDLQDVEHLVGVEGIFYAGSHGFRISGPEGWGHAREHGREFLPVLDQAERLLRDQTASIPGVLIERKYLAIAVHYRLVPDQDRKTVEAIVDRVLEAVPKLRMSRGKKVFDLQPDIDWNKGRAVLWLLDELGLDDEATLPLYLGDDVTDEDAFRALGDRGIGIVVKGADRATWATYSLDDPEQVRGFFLALLSTWEADHDG